MAALRIKVHLDGDDGVFKRDVVDQRLVDAVDVVVLVLVGARKGTSAARKQNAGILRCAQE